MRWVEIHSGIWVEVFREARTLLSFIICECSHSPTYKLPALWFIWHIFSTKLASLPLIELFTDQF